GARGVFPFGGRAARDMRLLFSRRVRDTGKGPSLRARRRGVGGGARDTTSWVRGRVRALIGRETPPAVLLRPPVGATSETAWPRPRASSRRRQQVRRRQEEQAAGGDGL